MNPNSAPTITSIERESRTLLHVLNDALEPSLQVTDTAHSYEFIKKVIESSPVRSLDGRAAASIIMSVHVDMFDVITRNHTVKVICGGESVQSATDAVAIEPVVITSYKQDQEVVDYELPDQWNVREQSPLSMRMRAKQTRHIVAFILETGRQRSIDEGKLSIIQDAYEAAQPFDDYADSLVDSARFIEAIEHKPDRLAKLSAAVCSLFALNMATVDEFFNDGDDLLAIIDSRTPSGIPITGRL